MPSPLLPTPGSSLWDLQDNKCSIDTIKSLSICIDWLVWDRFLVDNRVLIPSANTIQRVTDRLISLWDIACPSAAIAVQNQMRCCVRSLSIAPIKCWPSQIRICQADKTALRAWYHRLSRLMKAIIVYLFITVMTFIYFNFYIPIPNFCPLASPDGCLPRFSGNPVASLNLFFAIMSSQSLLNIWVETTWTPLAQKSSSLIDCITTSSPFTCCRFDWVCCTWY